MDQMLADALDAAAGMSQREIARAVNGKIAYTDFVPLTSWSGPAAPETMLPPLTARSLMEIFEQEIAPQIERQRARCGRWFGVPRCEAEKLAQRKSPRRAFNGGMLRASG